MGHFNQVARAGAIDTCRLGLCLLMASCTESQASDLDALGRYQVTAVLRHTSENLPI